MSFPRHRFLPPYPRLVYFLALLLFLCFHIAYYICATRALFAVLPWACHSVTLDPEEYSCFKVVLQVFGTAVHVPARMQCRLHNKRRIRERLRVAPAHYAPKPEKKRNLDRRHENPRKAGGRDAEWYMLRRDMKQSGGK